MTARITAADLLDITEFLDDRPAVARRAARLAINDITARRAVPSLRKKIEEEVNFPAGYVGGDRFGQTKKATDADLSATITARFRPTSLARFAEDQSFDGARRAGQVRVSIKGGSKTIKGAFFVRLRRGASTEGGSNRGLAIRLKPGQTIRGRKKGGTGVRLAENLYLLYGPSIDQVFRDISVAETPAIAEQLEREFLRQWIRLNTTTL